VQTQSESQDVKKEIKNYLFLNKGVGKPEIQKTNQGKQNQNAEKT